jgi:hypothetical protein
VNNPANLITVFRSMDAEAKEDAEVIVEVLADEGIQAALLDDSAPGVPEGVFEVQVAPGDQKRAEEIIAEHTLPEEAELVDPTSDLDLESVATAAAELEAISIKNLLEANGIATVLVGDSVLPNFPFEVRVARDQALNARAIIDDAERASKSET